MQRIIMSLPGARLDFIKTTLKLMNTKEYSIVNLSNDATMTVVSKEELKQYILLLELSKAYDA